MFARVCVFFYFAVLQTNDDVMTYIPNIIIASGVQTANTIKKPRHGAIQTL